MSARLWTAERVNRLKELYEQGLSYREMAADLGVNKNSIAGIINREKIGGRGTVIKPVWTKEQDEVLIRMQAEGLSYGEIGRRLGYSPSATGNRFRRLQLKKHQKAVKRTLKNVGNLAAAPKPVAPTPPPRYDKRMAELWKDLGGKCQWPEGDPKDKGYRVCGKRCKNAVYCEEHMALAYIVKPRQPAEFPAPRPELRSDFR